MFAPRPRERKTNAGKPRYGIGAGDGMPDDRRVGQAAFTSPKSFGTIGPRSRSAKVGELGEQYMRSHHDREKC
jgi:hypothetical protein